MAAKPSLAPVQVGRYVMYDAIGAGGMATVHLGRLAGEEGFGRTVAIKRLRPHYLHEPEVVKSFLDEARLAARVRHANVVSTIDIVSRDGELFVVMEYIEGESLVGLLKVSGGVVPIPVLVAVMTGALHGLHAAHEAVSEDGTPLRIVHRDVSPQNIIVGVDGVPRVLDFGVAKALGRQATTRDGEIKGKLSYMAPEQLSSGGVTRRTDVFASGIVLWELLVGKRLFAADDEALTMSRVLSLAIPRPSEVNPSAPRQLDDVVMRALERDPIRRFASADEMALALEECSPPAMGRVVGEWVKSLAQAKLEARAQMIRDIELHATQGSWSGARRAEPDEIVVKVDETFAPTESQPNRWLAKPRRKVALLAIPVAVLLAFAGLWAARGRTPPTTAVTVASTPPSAVPAPPPPETAAPPPVVSAPPPLAASSVPATTAAAPPHPAALPSKRKHGPASAASGSPLYSRD